MRVARVLGLIGAIVIAAVLGWRWNQRRGSSPPPPARTPTTRVRPGAPPDQVANEDATSHPKQIAPDARQRILRAIRYAQRQRVARKQRLAAPQRTSAGESPQPDDPGTLDKEYIRERIREIVPLVKECYEEALRETPDLEGKVVVQFTITGEPDIGGVIADSEVMEGSTIEDASLRECVQETMYALLMRAPDQGGEVIVTYPFMFRVAEP